MNRRHALSLLTGAVALGSSVARAQTAKTPLLVGFLHPGIRVRGASTMDALRRDVMEQKINGQALRLEERWGAGQPLLPLAQELVALRPDVLIAVSRPSIEAALKATSTIPIVANDLENDPVQSGWVASLGRPGGNLTGLFLDAPAICGKWLQQLTEMAPNLRKVAVLWDSATGPYQRDSVQSTAKAAGLEASIIEYAGTGTIEAALQAGLPADAQAVVQLGSPLINQAGRQIAGVLASRRLPGISPFRTFPENGGLLSYGPDLTEMYRRLGPIIFKVLNGTRPGELPIEQPSKFELVINRATARALGLTVPAKFLLSADDVID